MFNKGLLVALALFATFFAAEAQAQDGSDVMNAEWSNVAVLCDNKWGHYICQFKYNGIILYFDARDYYYNKENVDGNQTPHAAAKQEPGVAKQDL